MNQKSFAKIILVLAIVVLVCVVGYVTLVKKSLVHFITQQPNETADWKTYRNEKYGFEVKYPPKWIQCPTFGDGLEEIRVMVVAFGESDKKCRFGETGFDVPPKTLAITEEIAIFQEFSTVDSLKIALERASLSSDKLFIIKRHGGLFEVGEIKDVLFNGMPALEVYEGSPGGYGGDNAIYIFKDQSLLRIFSSLSYEMEKEKTTILSTFKFVE